MDRFREGDPVHFEDGSYAGTGTGHGARNVVIEFTPGQWPAPRDAAVRRGLWLYDPSHVLLHELVHAANYMAGSVRDSRTGRGFGRIEELRAVMVTNVFLSETRRMVRVDYGGTTVADRTASPRLHGYRGTRLEHNRRGLQHHRVVYERRQIELYMRDYPTLTWNLAALSPQVCEHNPFRAYRTGDYEWLLTPIDWCSPGCWRGPPIER